MIVLIISIFIIAYAAISLETYIHINKAATALICDWTIYIPFSHEKHLITEQLTERLGKLAGVLFFLLSAMTVAELIDVHGGFDIITRRINQTDKRSLVWTISLIAFFVTCVGQSDYQHRHGFAAAQVD